MFHVKQEGIRRFLSILCLLGMIVGMLPTGYAEEGISQEKDVDEAVIQCIDISLTNNEIITDDDVLEEYNQIVDTLMSDDAQDSHFVDNDDGTVTKYEIDQERSDDEHTVLTITSFDESSSSLSVVSYAEMVLTSNDVTNEASQTEEDDEETPQITESTGDFVDLEETDDSSETSDALDSEDLEASGEESFALFAATDLPDDEIEQFQEAVDLAGISEDRKSVV